MSPHGRRAWIGSEREASSTIAICGRGAERGVDGTDAAYGSGANGRGADCAIGGATGAIGGAVIGRPGEAGLTPNGGCGAGGLGGRNGAAGIGRAGATPGAVTGTADPPIWC